MPGFPLSAAWFASIVLVVAAIIDGRSLRVPNWLTYPMALAGLTIAASAGGTAGLATASGGMFLGLALLLPLYAIGGMGAGDVKLLAAVGAWVGPWATLGAFAATAIVGGLIAAIQIALSGDPLRHVAMFHTIVGEIVTLKDPAALSAIAAGRKPTMRLLPYGIPMAVGSIAYFAWAGLLA